MKQLTTRKIVLTALLTALVTVFTMFVRIPLPLGYVNLGDAFIFLAVFLLGPVLGTIAGGIGSCIADIIGYITYAPGTLVIKSLMAIVTWAIYTLVKKLTRLELVAEIVGGIIGSIIMAVGYFVYEILFFVSAGVAIVNLPWNILQGVVGVTVSVVVMRILFAVKIVDKIRD